MFFSTPIWLFALAAISIPVVIHLWNIKPGKTLKVGSISLFSQSSPASSRSFKLLDILLLLLRCLLLTLLAFLLAAPFWQQHLKTGRSNGWVLIPGVNFQQTYHKFQPVIDSLTNKGFELHYFGPGFAKQDLSEIKKDSTSTNTKKDVGTLNYWALVNQLENKVPPGTPVEIFAPNTIDHFTGTRPQTALNIRWHTYTPADSVATWLAGAWLTVNGNIKVLQGTSAPAGTSYQYNDIRNGGGQNGSAYTVSVENGLPYVNLNTSKIRVDTTVQRIAVYADGNLTDVGYVKAALQAIAQLTGRNSSIKLYNQADAVPSGQNWLFWLSEKPVSDAVLQKTKNIFCYEPGKINTVNSWINNSCDAATTQGQAKVALYKIVSAKTIAANPVWTDGFGNPVLSTEKRDQSTIYHFYSRFNPAWNELVWSDEFPKWLLTLTQPPADAVPVHERRALNNAQLQPVFVATADKLSGQQAIYTDLTRYLWLVLALIFFAERWLATKTKTVLANG
jgi:hypothetical protein